MDTSSLIYPYRKKLLDIEKKYKKKILSILNIHNSAIYDKIEEREISFGERERKKEREREQHKTYLYIYIYIYIYIRNICLNC